MRICCSRFLLFFFILLFSLQSCSNKSDEELFLQKLSGIDSYIEYGKYEKALYQLKKLKRKALTPQNYISIVKRLLKLHDKQTSVIILQEGVSKFSASPELSALLISILIDSGLPVDAVPYCENVENTIYAGIGAEASVLADIRLNSFNSNAPLLKSAYTITGDQTFLKNAALSLAQQGKLKEAADLRNVIDENTAPDEPYFWSCLYYDIGVFAPVFNDLYFSLIYSDTDGGFGRNAELASKHLMLAADSAYGQGDVERARAFWIAATDRTPERSPVVFYDLALTSPNEKERTDLLLECIELFPTYYPVIAHYIRSCIALKASSVVDDITEYLEKKGFYSMKMEETYFSSPKMTYTPDELLSKALSTDNFDIRFVLEEFRYRRYKDSVSQELLNGTADMWKLLEKYGGHSIVREYAKWYFSQNRDFNACFSVADVGIRHIDSFYKALSLIIDSEFEEALTEFASAHSDGTIYPVTVNSAYGYYMQGKADMALDKLLAASAMIDDRKEQSRLQYDIAFILASKKLYTRAISVLGYALELNPDNYKAKILLKKLEKY